MKKKLLLLVMTLLPIVAMAWNVTINGISYEINMLEKTAKLLHPHDDYISKHNGYVNIPSEVTYDYDTYIVNSIGGLAFDECSDLTSVTIPNSVTSIGNGAFYKCKGLTSVTIPNSVTSIGTGAFNSCENLVNVNIPNSLTKIESSVFYNCRSLKTVTIPNGVTSIGKSAFSSCVSLTSIVIPNSVTIIESCAFSYCYALTKVTIPNSVRRIDSSAFDSCKKLTTVIVGNGINSLSQYAFGFCTELTNFYCYTVKVPATSLSAFQDSNKNATLHVPAVSVEKYKEAAPWNKFTNIVALTDSDPTGIKYVENSNNKTFSVFDIAGKTSNLTEKGLKVVKTKDGSVKKVITK